jgi:hypothetical protein
MAMFRILAFFVLILAFTCFLVSCSRISAGTFGTCGTSCGKSAAASEVPQTAIRFDKFAVGALPEGFSTALTHEGPPGKWEIVDYKQTKVLAQTSTDETDGRYPLCIYDGANFKNGTVSVDFMAVSGKVDQAAGLVARYRNKDNYYITRANALEDNVRLYKVEAGKRTQLASANLKVTPNQWHNLKFELAGPQLTVFYDDKKLFEVADTTFEDSGKVGLWTKADSVTYFDNLTIKSQK